MLDKKVAEADLVVTISEYNKEVIVEECGEEARDKVRVIHCGVDPTVFQAGGLRRSAAVHVICVASLEPIKGHQYLIEACRILNERGVEFVCDLVGEGRLRHALEKQIADSGLRERVILHGARPRSEVAAMLRQADIAVLASAPTQKGDREGIPVALMEAMATRLPVVSSAISGIPELVESGVSGYLVAPRDVDGLADALERLCRDWALRYTMGAYGRDRVVRDFNLRTNANALLHEIVSMHRRDPKTAA